jgi:hypothetical protein
VITTGEEELLFTSDELFFANDWSEMGLSWFWFGYR